MIEENNKCFFYNKCNHIDCETFCLKKYKLLYYLNSSFIPRNKWVRTPLFLDDDNSDLKPFSRLSEIEKNIVRFVDNGENLFIYSQNTGNGKTSWCFRLALSYIEKTWGSKNLYPTVLFINVPRFLIELKQSITEKSAYIDSILKNADKADLVIWDDIGSKNGTEFEVSHMLSIIDKRILDNKTNIYTSNLNNEELHTALGDRLYSRIFNDSECLELVGKDKRGI